MYELDGQLFESEVDFLEAAKKEYLSGDRQLALDTLEEYGFDINDLGVE